jgi:hypothetical protein
MPTPIPPKLYLVQDRSLYIDFSPELTLVILVTITAVDDTKSILGIARQELSRTLAGSSKNIHQQKHVFSWRQIIARGIEFMKNIRLVIYGQF